MDKVARNQDDKFISVKIPYTAKEWSSYPVGLYRKEVEDPIEAIQKSFERMARLLPNIKKSTRALVFNSGYGIPAIYLADKYGCKIDCICNTEESFKKTEALVKKFGFEDQITFTTCKFEEVPYSGETFDLVWSMDSLSFNEDKPTTLKEVARLLVPEGRFIFSDYTKTGFDLDDLWVPIESSDRKRKLITSKEYIKLADKADLERVYILEDSDQLKTHFSFVQKEVKNQLKAKSATAIDEHIIDLVSQIDNKSLSWCLYQFQKRNV